MGRRFYSHQMVSHDLFDEAFTLPISGGGDIASAYFCECRSDDPAMYRRIIIFEDVNLGPLYLIDVLLRR